MRPARAPLAVARRADSPLSRAAYLERTYPLRPSVEDPLAIPVQLEGITIDKMREVSTPRAHRRTSSQVSHSEGYSPEQETEPMLPLNGHASSSTAPAVPKVNKMVLLRRVAMDQIVMCVRSSPPLGDRLSLEPLADYPRSPAGPRSRSSSSSCAWA